MCIKQNAISRGKRVLARAPFKLNSCIALMGTLPGPLQRQKVFLCNFARDHIGCNRQTQTCTYLPWLAFNKHIKPLIYKNMPHHIYEYIQIQEPILYTAHALALHYYSSASLHIHSYTILMQCSYSVDSIIRMHISSIDSNMH